MRIHRSVVRLVTCFIVVIFTTHLLLLMYDLLHVHHSVSEQKSSSMRQYVNKIRLGDTVDINPVFNYKRNITKYPQPDCHTPGIIPPNKMKLHNTVSCRLPSRKPNIILLVKSKADHYGNRQAIRETWGDSNNLLPTYFYRTFFVVGSSQDDLITELVHKEFEYYNDIVQVDYIESYFQNTLKTMNAIHWVVHNYGTVKHVAMIDDDFYLNPKLLMELVTEKFDMDKLYLGNEGCTTPSRSKNNKWYISYNEYQYDRFPPFVTGGLVLFTMETLKDFEIAAKYVKSFRFDDVYLGILADELAITPVYTSGIQNFCDPWWMFVFYRLAKFPVFEQMIASHCFSNPDNLKSMWTNYLTVFHHKQ